MFRYAVPFDLIKYRRMRGRACSTVGGKYMHTSFWQRNVDINTMKYEKTNCITPILRKQERRAWAACM
jgi:hypothetical protein